MLCDDLTARTSGKTVVVGVGDAARGDDGAGPMVARLLMEAGVENVIDSGSSPELDTWAIRTMSPDSVLFVDAVDFGGSPGDSALVEPEDLRESGFDTHRAPLRLTMRYLQSELACKCCLLAIQPRDVRQGARMCEEVRKSAEHLARMLVERLSSQNPQLQGEKQW